MVIPVVSGSTHEQHARFELAAFLDAAVDAVVVIDHRGRIETFNRAAEKLFGYSAAEVLGKNVSVLMPEPDCSAHDAYMARYLATGEARIIGKAREVRALRKDGTGFPVLLSVGRIEGTNPPRFVGFVHDLAAQRNVEAQAALAQEKLHRLDRLSIMGEMASGLAHEVNQPLAAINTFAQAARRLLQGCSGEALDDIAGALDQISEQALRAGDIIQWLRSFSRNQGSGHEPLDCNKLIAQVLPLAQVRARRHAIEIRTQLEVPLPLVSGNSSELQQILLNLLNNSIDAMLPSGGGRIITLSTRSAGDDVEVAVTDTGPGLSAAARERLFSPFFTTKEQGTGLGLAIGVTIMRAHGGRLQYRDPPAGGACFYFSLPALAESEP
jgi:two-component system sensor kinase FixL